VYEVELQILLWWMSKSYKENNKKFPGVQKSNLPKQTIAQVLVDILKKPDTPPFTLTPTQIYSGIFLIAISLFCYFNFVTIFLFVIFIMR
jgi:hypothetical protein